MLADDIRKFFKGEVADDDATLEAHSRDYSIFKVKPKLVVFPKDAEDVKNLVKFVSILRKKGNSISLTARSAGTDMTGGPLTESIVVSFTRHMNKIVEIGGDPERGQAYAIVQPGVYFRDLEKLISEKNLMFPSYPASKDLCAIGGMIMNNSGGEKTLRYGKTDSHVAEIKTILADGEEHVIKPISRGSLENLRGKRDFESTVWRKLLRILEKNQELIASSRPDVSKNSSGYSLWNVWDGNVFDPVKIFVGSQGTLGLMTEVKIRLMSRPKHSKLIVVFLRDISLIADLVNAVLQFNPESVESYDDKTLGVAIRFLPSLVRMMRTDFFKLAAKFYPEALMVLFGGLPKMVLLVSLTDDTEGNLNKKTEDLVHLVKSKFRLSVRAVKNKEEEEKYWAIRRQSFALLHGHIKDRDTAPFIDDIIVRPQYLPKFLPELNAILDKYKQYLIYTIAGHPGDGNFHIIPLVDLRDPIFKKLIPKISEEVYELVLKYRGSITAEHNDGLIRTPYVKRMYGEEMYELFKTVKKIFDPLNVFNPRKKIGGSLAYSMNHVSTERT